MKEIKFRAWDKDEKAMLILLALRDETGNVLMQRPTQPKTVIRNRPDRVDVMQYTGLKDKNGTDVYEGDLLGHESRHLKSGVKSLHEVKWESELACFEMPSPLNQFEIVGSIYENPELLK